MMRPSGPRAQAVCDGLAAGDIERASEDFSVELQRNLGEVLALLPLPANEVEIVSIERGGSGFNVVLRVAGEIDQVLIQTRWKDRDSASHGWSRPAISHQRPSLRPLPGTTSSPMEPSTALDGAMTPVDRRCRPRTDVDAASGPPGR